MALRNIRTEEDPLLRKPSREVREITPRILTLVEDMWETMEAASGVGLAAPQVGVLRRVVVIDATPPPEEEAEAGDGAEAQEAPAHEAAPPDASAGPETEAPALRYALINPSVVWRSEEEVVDKEGCLSVPGYAGQVSRPARVRVEALDPDGTPLVIEAEGLLARALCHEIDHLDGILYTDFATEVEKLKPEGEEAP